MEKQAHEFQRTGGFCLSQRSYQTRHKTGTEALPQTQQGHEENLGILGGTRLVTRQLQRVYLSTLTAEVKI